MDLYLVRHAIAYDRDPVTWPVDSERPLTKAGIEKFRQAARGLHALVPSVDLVLSGPWVRAWDTALLLQEEARWPAPERCDLLTGDDFEALLAAIAAHTSDGSVALVGYEPYLSGFATALLAPSEDRPLLEMKKGSIACIDCAAPALGSPAVLRWLLQPRILRRLA